MNGRLNDPGNWLPLDVTELRRSTSADGGRTSAGLVFLGGLAVVGGCSWLLFDAWRSSTPDSVFGLLLGLLLGLGVVYRKWRPVMLICRTALPHGEISPCELAVGDEFSFCYRQKVRRPFQAAVTTSLVLRETITIKSEEGPDTQVKRDHLVSARTEQALWFPAGESLQIQCTFGLPDDMRGFPVHNWPVACVIKVHVLTQRGAGYWEEFLLPLSVDVSSQFGQGQESEAKYQVTLVSFPRLYQGLSTPPPLDEYLLHLTQVDRLPLVLLRGITQTEAVTVCRRLEAAGGVVELAYGGRVIQRVHNLPLPAEMAGPAHQGLPLPASATDRALPSDNSRHTDESTVSDHIRRP